ncbi:MAG: helix-turn-helix transcriptional regulator [Candidatus Moranbacteria bacterium]|nr:helix-turn-helix transcriptional regulator [Candidatus Moranbacteria bacterium]
MLNPLTLTPREADVLRLLCVGYGDKAIAHALAISVCTVQKHLQAIYKKLEVDQYQGNTRGLTSSLAIAGGMVQVQVGGGDRRHGRGGERRLRAAR